jgi:hypothetical protein
MKGTNLNSNHIKPAEYARRKQSQGQSGGFIHLRERAGYLLEQREAQNEHFSKKLCLHARMQHNKSVKARQMNAKTATSKQ